MRKQNMSMSDSFVSEDSYISQIDRNYFKDISFFSKQFCKPIEIKLNQERQTNITVEEGIQIVERVSLDDIRPTSRNVAEAVVKELKQDIQDIRFVNGDGLISMFKDRVDLPLKVRVAICVTVYSEDKEMLKKTLDGIKQNYKIFLEKAGILSHEIVVVVIFDGIEKVNNQKDSVKNMVSLFKEFDLMNGFRKKEYLIAKRDEGVMQKEVQFYNDEKHQLENYNDDLLFTEKQLEQLNDSLFQTQYLRYIQMSKLVRYIKQLSKKKIQSLLINEMPSEIKILFMDHARRFMQNNNINNITQDDDQLQKYLEENMAVEKLQMLKFEAIKQAEKIAKDYLQSRQGTAILYQMALPIVSYQEETNEKQDNPNLRLNEEDPKMFTFFVVKHNNSGKLSSHLWFFEGFCNIIQPDMCVLIDCGLKPASNSIFKMWAHIQTYKFTCGGVCGYMGLSQQNPCDDLGYRTDQFDQKNIDCLTHISTAFVDIQKAQMFEYHFAHMLDKPFEACFGYIHVLPGAFSGYNWLALRHEKIKIKKKTGLLSQKQIEKKKKQRILRKYLKTVIYNQTLDDIKEANMYLAEDRILCLEIYSKKNHKFNLEYLPDAESVVDPVTSLIRMLGQRKRWINGTWFALQYVLDNRKRVNQSEHSNWDKFKFRSNMFYSAFNKAVSYIGISLFFIIMHFMVQQYAQNQFLASIQKSFDISSEAQLNRSKIFYDFFSLRSLVNALVGLVDFFYILCIGVCIYYSLTLNKHTNQSKRVFNLISTIFGIYGLFSIILVFYNFVGTLISKSQSNYSVQDSFIEQSGIFNLELFIYLFGIIVISHIVIILINFDFKKYYEILVSLPSYFFFVPSYIHLMFIYAFCRIDDLSWGTKGLDGDQKKKEQKITAKFKNEKLRFVFRWITINVALSLSCIALSNSKTFQTNLIWVISFYVIIVLEIRMLFALIYLIKYHFFTKRHVIKQTLNQKKKLLRVQQGRKIKQNLKTYIEDAKNYGLDQHIQEIKQDLKYYSAIKKTIVEEQRNIIEQKSKLLSGLHSVSNLKKLSQLKQNEKPVSELLLQNESVRIQKHESKVSKQKLYVRANDKTPILAQIFNTGNIFRNLLGKNDAIDYSDLQKYTELNKLKPKDKKLKYFQLENQIAEQMEIEEQQSNNRQPKINKLAEPEEQAIIDEQNGIGKDEIYTFDEEQQF